MRKGIIFLTAIAAGLIGCGLAENGLWFPAIGCGAYLFLLVWANTRTKKKPRGATRDHDKRYKTQIVNFYDSAVTVKTQAKISTSTGKMIMPMYYEL